MQEIALNQLGEVAADSSLLRTVLCLGITRFGEDGASDYKQSAHLLAGIGTLAKEKLEQ